MCKLLLNSPRAWVYSTPAVASQPVAAVVVGPCCGSGLWGRVWGIKRGGCALGVKENPVTAVPCCVGVGGGGGSACQLCCTPAPSPPACAVPRGAHGHLQPAPPPRTCSRRLSGGFGSPTLSSAQQGGSKNPPPGWAPHAHTRGTGSFHVSLIERAQRAAASSPRVQKLGGGIAYCIALRARAAPRCRPPCQGVASYKTKPSLHKTLSVQNKYS